uniref:Uncharacterized protein n=1 Tax=Meloidogyne hapla TaxID=6305 RepID=A0A1I8BTN7_MELHA
MDDDDWNKFYLNISRNLINENAKDNIKLKNSFSINAEEFLYSYKENKQETISKNDFKSDNFTKSKLTIRLEEINKKEENIDEIRLVKMKMEKMLGALLFEELDLARPVLFKIGLFFSIVMEKNSLIKKQYLPYPNL